MPERPNYRQPPPTRLNQLGSLGLGAALLFAAALMHGQTTSTPPHLHHIRLRVADPAVAMDRYATSNRCTKTIVQGVGVGVRCGTAYLLFDRNSEPATSPTVRGRVTVDGSGDAATIRAEIAVADPVALRNWLRDQAHWSSDASLNLVPMSANAASLPDDIADVGVGSSDPAPIVSRLTASGTRVLSRGAESIRVAAPGGLTVEIVHDTGIGPDAYWCAMHPDVRSPTPGKCPICGMTLVPIPPPIFGDDRMDVVYKPSGKNQGRLTIRITDPKTNAPRKSFLVIHDRPFHLFIVNRDLSFFAHVHPDVHGDGTLTLDVSLPKPDLYMLYGDFYPSDGTPQLVQASVVTPDYTGIPFPDPEHVSVDPARTRDVDGVRASLSAPPLEAGRNATLTLDLADAASGAPITDIEPYIGAAGHLFIVSADLTDADHSHPSDLRAKGPRLTFNVRPSQSGTYKLWVQFQRRGHVSTVPFMLTVH